ncbi:CHAD domain-containing protein [Marivibrio halodurans]|uniref:CHAD domain-containing protein n=1 Tax=Marivibrio halodurans TaxID=2039722 RepID=A0A8J7RZW7_9PROT|nr:CYTH and CHAD domain-containing protein [Marivibrio halodurans]MBP5856124.1 CHAD domain-containing protein [Marivibrio halodurans]
MASAEIELKLTIDAASALRLRRDRYLHAVKRGRARNQRLIAVYFDTDALDLKAAGIALRLRQEGRRRVQTVKCPIGAPGGGVQKRLEVEAPITGTEPDLSLIDDPSVAERVRAAVGDKTLKPVFSTDVKRTIWMIDQAEGTIELALDEGEIASAGAEGKSGGRVIVREAELELKAGSPTALLAFAEDLRERVPFRIGGESKAARGYALFLEASTAIAKAGEPALDPAMSAQQALSAILADGISQLLANEAMVLEGTDPEGVHQARVAVRRMRAALSAFTPVLDTANRKHLAKPLRWVQQALGPARDWDVFLSETLAPVRARAGAHPGLTLIEKHAARKREKAYRQAEKALFAKRYQRMILRLEGFEYSRNPLAEALPVGRFAWELLQQRYDRVRADGGADPRDLETEALHALRIEIKKLRYAVEFFKGLYDPKAVASFLQATKKLQDCLGALNDAVVAERLLAELVPEAADPDIEVETEEQARIEEALSVIREVQSEQIQAGLAKLSAAWERLLGERPFWKTGAPPGAA